MVSNNEKALKSLYVNKQRVLAVTCRGSSLTAKKIIEDLQDLLPHTKRTKNVARKLSLTDIKDINIEMNCNFLLLVESRNRIDNFIWIGDCIKGPTLKFYVDKYDSKNQFRFSGNCLKASRPLLVFSKKFNDLTLNDDEVVLNQTKDPWSIVRNALHQLFNVPYMHPKSQPFCDKVAMFDLDQNQGLIFIRFYQIISLPKNSSIKDSSSKLQEIGPRLSLKLIKIHSGCLSGPLIYKETFTNSLNKTAQINMIKSLEKRKKFNTKILSKQKKIAQINQIKVNNSNKDYDHDHVDTILRNFLS